MTGTLRDLARLRASACGLAILVSCALFVGCTSSGGKPGPSVALDLAVDPDMPLRVLASWDASAAPRAWVRFEEGRVTPVSTTGSIALLGLPADIAFTAELVTDEGVVGEASTTTGSLPAEAPELVVEGALDGGYLLVGTSPHPGAIPVLYVLDAAGRIVFYHAFPEAGAPLIGAPSGWGLQPDGGGVWVQISGTDNVGMQRVSFDASDDRWVDLPGAHHEVLRRDDGSVAYLRGETRTVNGEPATGDLLVVRATDGTERVAWDPFATLPIERHAGWYFFENIPGDWTHANGIAWNPEARQWTVSLFWLRTLVVIDDATGAIVRTLDGRVNPAPFGPQHSPRWSGDGWWVFDNADVTRGSGAVHFSPTGDVLARWFPPEKVFTAALGDVLALDDGRLLVGGGTVPATWLGAPDASPDFRIAWPGSTLVGQQHLVASLYAEPLAE